MLLSAQSLAPNLTLPGPSVPRTSVLGQLRAVPQSPAGRLSPSQPWHRLPPGHAHVSVPSHNFLWSSAAD